MHVTESPERATASVRDPRATTPEWEHEWRDAAALELVEAPGPHTRVGGVIAAAVLAGLLPAIFPLSLGYPSSNTTAQVVTALIAAAVAVAIVPFSMLLARMTIRHHSLVYGVAVFSAGAAAIHFAVAKSHFSEYFLYGLFFVLSGLAQLVWAVLVVFRPARWLFASGAIGNLLIVVVWGVDRIWGLPIGPDPWKPESVGFSDVTASAFELALVAGCVALLVRRAGTKPQIRSRLVIAVCLTVAVVALAAMSLLSAIGVGSPLITPSA